MKSKALFSEVTNILIATPYGQISMKFIKHGIICCPGVLQLYCLSRKGNSLLTLTEKMHSFLFSYKEQHTFTRTFISIL